MNEFEELKEGLVNLSRSNQKILDELKRIQNQSSRWLDIPESCAWLKCSTRTLQNYRDDGLIPFSKVRGKIYIRESDLQEFLNSRNTVSIKS
jgi:hypothetical protein